MKLTSYPTDFTVNIDFGKTTDVMEKLNQSHENKNEAAVVAKRQDIKFLLYISLG